MGQHGRATGSKVPNPKKDEIWTSRTNPSKVSITEVKGSTVHYKYLDGLDGSMSIEIFKMYFEKVSK